MFVVIRQHLIGGVVVSLYYTGRPPRPWTEKREDAQKFLERCDAEYRARQLGNGAEVEMVTK